MEKPTTTEPDAKQQNEQMQTQIEREKPIDPIECCATAAAWFTGDFALLCEKSPSMRQQKELLQEGSLIQGPGFLRDFLWTAAALLPLSPSTACCGDFSQVSIIHSQQQAAEIKAAAGLPQSRELGAARAKVLSG